MKSARELVDRLRAYQPPNTDLGQHFLIDDAMLERMTAIAKVDKDDHVLEIGPGPGTLTQHLLETKASVTAIEIDDAPVLHLDEVFREEQNTKQLILHHDDALHLAWPTNITKVVANIPYQISSPLIEKLTQHLKQQPEVLQTVVLMVQHEFGQRLSMKHPADVGSLGMTVALDWDVVEHHLVAPHHFSPQPAVQSQVIELRPHKNGFFCRQTTSSTDDSSNIRATKEKDSLNSQERAKAHLSNQTLACSAVEGGRPSGPRFGDYGCTPRGVDVG